MGISLDTVLVALGQDPAALEEHAILRVEEWETFARTFPTDGPFFLETDYLTAACAEVSMPDAAAAATLDAARRVAARPIAVALAWHYHRVLFSDSPSSPAPDERAYWPPLDGLLGGDAALFYVLVVLSGLPRQRRFYAARAIPPRVARDTLEDVARLMLMYHRIHGRWGVDPTYVGWLCRHLRGEIFHLVRLQFEPGPFVLAVRAFRRRATEAVIALSEDGIRYRMDGQIDGAGGVYDPSGAWTARLRREPGTIVGSPILPIGVALQEEVRLSLAEWQQVLAPGDLVLRVHIPEGPPPLDPASCKESFEEALAFFPRYCPEQPFVAFACASWLLDAQLEALLPAASNLVRFQQEMYLVPIPSDGRGVFEYVFDRAPADLRTAPRDTALRRALLDHLLSGGHLRDGGCFLLPRDLTRWGTHIYRRQRQAPTLDDEAALRSNR